MLASNPRQTTFVGRQYELSQLRQWWHTGRARLACVWGPGGIGKTSLGREFGRQLTADGHTVVWIDCTQPGMTPALLREQVGQEASEHGGKRLLVLDNADRFRRLGAWLSNEMPRLSPAPDRILLLGRQLPDELQDTPADDLQLVTLRQFNARESAQLLGALRIDPDLHASWHQRTQGHPMLLWLLATLGSGERHQHAMLGEFIRHRLLDEAGDEALEAGLIMAAVVRSIHADLLRAAPEIGTRASEVLRWLTSLGIVSPAAAGYVMHDLVREHILAHIRLTTPERHDRLRETARQWMVGRLLDRTPFDRASLIGELLWLVREAPQIRLVFEGFEQLGLYLDVPRTHEWPEIVACLRQHEGPQVASLWERWQQTGLMRTMVVRGPDHQWLGFSSTLVLHDPPPAELADDPGLVALQAVWKAVGGLRSGERVVAKRFWADRQGHHASSPVQARIYLHVSEQAFLIPGQVALLGIEDPRTGRVAAAAAFAVEVFSEFAEANGEPRIWIGHNWRTNSLRTWLDHGTAVAGSDPGGPVPVPQGEPVALSHPDFVAEVRRVLRHWHRPEHLQTSPLLQSRLVRNRIDPGAGDAERVAYLRELFTVALEQLQNAPGTVRIDLLAAVFLATPRQKQSQVAQTVHMAPSTLRLHLKRAVEQLADRLWEWELGG